MEINLGQGGSRPARLLFGVFALIGVLASIVTIAQFFQSSEQSSLSVVVTQHKFQTPLYPGKAVQSDQPARLLGQKLRDELCKQFPEDVILKAAYSDISEKFKEQEASATDCKKAQQLEFSSRWLGEFSESNAALYEYTVKNDGEKPAEGMRLQSSSLNAAQYSFNNDKFVELQVKDGESYYSLPILNPGESFTILAWTSASFFDLPYRDWSDLPLITYSGAKIHTEFMKPIPDGWYNAYDFVSETPWILMLIFVTAAAFVIVFIFVGLIGLVQAVTTGKSLSEVFKSEDPVLVTQANSSEESPRT